MTGLSLYSQQLLKKYLVVGVVLENFVFRQLDLPRGFHQVKVPYDSSSPVLCPTVAHPACLQRPSTHVGGNPEYQTLITSKALDDTHGGGHIKPKART